VIRTISTHFARSRRVHLVEVRRGRHCPRCGGPECYSHAPNGAGTVGYHRAFCMRCDTWMERECGGYPCLVCGNTPVSPSKVEGRTVLLNPQLLD